MLQRAVQRGSYFDGSAVADVNRMRHGIIAPGVGQGFVRLARLPVGDRLGYQMRIERCTIFARRKMQDAELSGPEGGVWRNLSSMVRFGGESRLVAEGTLL